MLDLSGISLPFSVKDLVLSGNGLLALIGGFVLLALAFGFSKEIMWTIRTAIITHKNGVSSNDEWAGKYGKWTAKDTIKSTYEKGKYRGWGR